MLKKAKTKDKTLGKCILQKSCPFFSNVGCLCTLELPHRGNYDVQQRRMYHYMTNILKI